MIREKDYVIFAGLMAMMGEAVAPFKQPSSDRIEMYFMTLEDLEYEEIESAAKNHLRYNKWFPAIPELRGETEELANAEAQKDCDLVAELCEHLLWPGFWECGMVVIKQKLTEKKKEHLIPLLQRWGRELVGNKPGVARAQMLKSHVADITVNRKRLQGPEHKQIYDKQSKMLEGLDKIGN